MNKIIVSEARYRQRVVKYSFNHGVSRAAIRFRVCRQSIYNWRIRYDGESWKSLVEGSHRPEHHPNEHTPKELEDIQKRYPPILQGRYASAVSAVNRMRIQTQVQKHAQGNKKDVSS